MKMPQKMILAWKRKVRLTHLCFKKKMLLKYLQKSKYNAFYSVQKNRLASYFAKKTLHKIVKC